MELTDIINAADVLDKARRGAADESVSKIEYEVWDRLNRAKHKAAFRQSEAELAISTGRGIADAMERYREALLDRRHYEDLIAAHLYAASQEDDSGEN